MERPEIKLGGPQRELEEPQRELKLRETHGMEWVGKALYGPEGSLGIRRGLQ